MFAPGTIWWVYSIALRPEMLNLFYLAAGVIILYGSLKLNTGAAQTGRNHLMRACSILIAPQILAIVLLGLYTATKLGWTTLPSPRNVFQISGSRTYVAAFALIAECALFSSVLLYKMANHAWHEIGFRLPSTKWTQTGIFTIASIVLILLFEVVARFFARTPELPVIARLSHTTSLQDAFPVIWLLLVVPIVEELFFRGVLLEYLKQAVSAPTAILAQAIIFALMHHQPEKIIAYFGMGATLGFLSTKTKSLAPCIFVHSLLNLLYYL